MKEKCILNNLLERYPLLKGQKENIWQAFLLMADSFWNHGKLLVAGNGGSAADAEHIVGELMKGFVKTRSLEEEMISRMEAAAPGTGTWIGQKLQQALPAIAVTCHTALSTAYANDREPDLAFAQQVYGYGNEKDIFLGISTSGNSKNVWYACIAAKARGMKVVALTGNDGGRLKGISDVTVVVPCEETYRIQELHMPVYHCWCLMLEERFF